MDDGDGAYGVPKWMLRLPYGIYDGLPIISNGNMPLSNFRELFSSCKYKSKKSWHKAEEWQ